MRFSHFLLAATLSTAGLAGMSGAAHAACGDAVSFAKGTSQGTVTGRFTGYDVCDHTIRARAGQTLSATLKAGPGAEAIVVSPVEHALDPGEPLVLPQDGTYTLRVLQTRNEARRGRAQDYRLTVAVSGAAKQATSAKPAKAQAGGNICDGSGALVDGTANMSGTLAGSGSCDYTVKGQKGQSLTLLLDARPGVEVWLRAVNADNGVPLAPDQPVVLDQTGDYLVIVGRTRNDVRKGGSRDFSAVVNVE